ncbi:hypothetical protein CYMTET_42535 [Cymbomonas tetramitiformis]|uniref:Uncharacterized protein n=1 Tax=Cymbomonas tetramitiformis TaxID=36881 RepID=A0AAE0C594_9CHLO|nr:hypothetical protein CYMTET_42535 [Cymbomonas tetramitiformis]
MGRRGPKRARTQQPPVHSGAQGKGKGTDTWEPLKNLPGLEDVIKEFEQKLESEKAEHAREVAEGKEKKRKERSRDVEGDEETEFETPPKNLRSPFWKHFKVRMEGKKIIDSRQTNGIAFTER